MLIYAILITFIIIMKGCIESINTKKPSFVTYYKSISKHFICFLTNITSFIKPNDGGNHE